MTVTPNGIRLAHDDHDLQIEHLEFIDYALADWDGGFIIKVLELPDHCPDLPSALYGPTAGDQPITEDQVFYEKRGKRRGPSRLIKAPMRLARNMVVIGAWPKHEKTPLLFTAYGTQSTMASPREWWDLAPVDLSDETPEESAKILRGWFTLCNEAISFWQEHALATGE
tara:strand:+ start:222 stop:728 length:507 start_codon:yes stop_codon:yes gene_type:complete